MSVLEWLGMLALVGGFAALTESNIKRSEQRIMQKLDRMHDHVFGIYMKTGAKTAEKMFE